MKKFTLLFLFIVLIKAVSGQQYLSLKHPPTREQAKQEGINHQCVHRNKYSAIQRLNFYPFNKAAQIKLVSFNDSSAFENRIPLINDTVNYSQLIEIKTLTKTQRDKLTDIIYNIGDRAPNWFADAGASCYNPHNAILFVDKFGRTFAYIEICFECSRYQLSSRKIRIGQFCEEKYSLVKNYFGTNGIKVGITQNTH